MTKTFKTPGIITKITTMADGGFRVQCDTNELTPEVAADLMGLNRQYGMLLFAPENGEIKETDLVIPEEQKEFPNQKSLSERLRNSLYRLWEAKGKLGDFEDYRRRYMEKIIDNVKAKIDENQI